jgi:hypothetical protein
MWLLIGELRRIIKRPADAVGSKFQVQILSEEQLKSGETRESLLTLGTDDPRSFEPLVGSVVAVQASPYGRKDGTLGVSISDGASVRLAAPLLDTRA